MDAWAWTWIALVAGSTPQDSNPALRAAPQLQPDLAALTLDIVVYGTHPQGEDVIETTIRSPDPDLSALTAGLVSGGAPERSDQSEAMRISSAFTGGREARTASSPK